LRALRVDRTRLLICGEGRAALPQPSGNGQVRRIEHATRGSDDRRSSSTTELAGGCQCDSTLEHRARTSEPTRTARLQHPHMVSRCSTRSRSSIGTSEIGKHRC
jgi:hypothetical protein